MFWISILFLFLLAVILIEILQVLLASAPKTPHKVVINSTADSADPITDTIPRIVWSFWQQPVRPDLVALCEENWKRMAPDHEIRSLSPANIAQWIPPEMMIETFDSLPAYRQADWLRIQLLARYGGIWVDASIVFAENLDWLHTLQQKNHTEFAGFYINKDTLRLEQPIVENWFMGAIQNSIFVKDLADEFTKAVLMGEQNYLDTLKEEGIFEAVIQGIIEESRTYLIMHVAASALMYRHPHKYSLALLKAEDTAFCYHQALHWRKRHLYAKLAVLSCPKRLPVLIKLRGADRRVFNKYVAQRKFSKNSFLAKFLTVGD